jgi:transcriptional regulator with XRE-family HTH domain
MKFFIPNMRSLRETKKLTQNELATTARVGRSTVARLELGGACYKSQAVKIANALGIDFSDDVQTEESDRSDFEPKGAISVPIGQICSSPLRRKLSAQQREMATKSFYEVGRYLVPTLDEFCSGFEGDLHPDAELALWEKMGHALSRLEQTYELDEKERKQAATYLLIRSTESKSKARKALANFDWNRPFLKRLEKICTWEAVPVQVIKIPSPRTL